jgi:type II secretory pathway component PulJ
MKTREYGQTIIEVLVALSTAVIIVSATTVAVLTALA